MLGEIIGRVRSRHPLVHCITNYVTANDCANLLLASGSSAIMADAPEEAAEITGMCDGLVINMGTPNRARLSAMMNAGLAANTLSHPVVLDPVGVGGSAMRQSAARNMLSNIRFAAIRGNISEIRTLAEGTAAHRGVDADIDAVSAERAAIQLSLDTGAVVLVTGETDFVTDGRQSFRCTNGHPMMRLVTGTGCQLSAFLGACLAANAEKPLMAALAAVCTMGLCGETAFARLRPEDGNATLRNFIIDAMYHMTPEMLEEGARYDIYP
ncbi:MAG: hydroxyethylthiazole kinase [Clostridia bacterium]|nr:hydroxyethylthiazole kinase [Clostridia bacterium]